MTTTNAKQLREKKMVQITWSIELDLLCYMALGSVPKGQM